MKNQPKILLFGACLTIVGLLLSSDRAMAQDVTISNGGSYAVINLGGGSGNIGMNAWEVGNHQGDMQNELDDQWFWYQIGNGGAVNSIDNLGLQSYAVTSDDGGTDNELTTTYADSDLSIIITYELLGAGMGSGTANIYEGITMQGLNGFSQTVNLFQYSNFNLLQNNNNNLQVYPDGSGGFYYANQTAGASAIAEGIINPDANNAEAGLAGDVLADVEAGNLNGNSLEDQGDDVTLTAEGDVAWAFEWSAEDGDLDIQKQKQLSVQGVPEPSSIALIGLGLGVVGWLRRRQA